MFHKRRLTGYLEDTEKLIQNRRDEWEERANPGQRGHSKRRGARSGRSSPRSKSPAREAKRRLGIGPCLPVAIDDHTDVDVLPPGTRRPGTPQTCKIMQTTEKHVKSRSLSESDRPREHVKFDSKTLKKDRKKKRMADKRSEESASVDSVTNSCARSRNAHIFATTCAATQGINNLGPTKSEVGLSASVQIGFQKDGYSSLHASVDGDGCDGHPRPSSSIRITTPSEKKLMDLARSGSVPLVQRYLTSRPKVNINARSFEGESALRIAVKMGHEGLVMFFSCLKNIELGDVLFHAIYHKQFAIVKLLCEHHDLDRESTNNHGDFPKYVTPLSLAGEVGMYEIIEYLIKVRKHEVIQVPHQVRCRCQLVCNAWKKGDPIDVAYQMLHIYSALSRPSYFFHVTDDPITWAFHLHQSLIEVAEFHVALKSCFLKLAKRLQNFSVRFIAECRNSAEIKAILSHSAAATGFFDTLSASEIPTLLMALDQDQKCFVAHPNVQVVVKDIWQGDYHKWRVMNPFKKAVMPFVRLLSVPYIYYLLLAQPASRATRRFALPLNKMLLSLACYICFLGFIFYANVKPRPKVRAPYTFKDIEFYVVIFVLAYTCNTVRQALLMHPRRFFRYGWNIYDVSTLAAFWLAIAFWISAQIHYNMIPANLQSLERKYWGGLDPVLMADGFFVIGSLLAYLRLLFYFQISKHIGPMQVAMDAMVKEFIKYSVFWLLILLSFTVALGKFYSYYSGMKYVDPETGMTMKQENGFVDFKSTFNTLFWGIFGLSSYVNADVVIENITTRNGTYLNKHDFTEFIGYFAFGSYTIMMGIIVINMIIATMSAAFARVLIDGEAEWSVQETHVYVYYMCHSVLPPPFNIVPHRPVGTGDALKPKVTRSAFPVGCPSPPPPLPPPPPPPVSELVKKIVLRYFHTKAEKKRKKPVCFYPR